MKEAVTESAVRILPESFTDVYTVDTEIGRGKFAVVKRCQHNVSGEVRAAKLVHKRRKGRDCRGAALREVEMLRVAQAHPRIVNLIEVYETRNELVLVTEYARGGELFNHIAMEGQLEEGVTQRLMRQVLEGVLFLHQQNIIHMDIKPQNILLTELLPAGDVILCDLGLARTFSSGEDILEIVGTPDYVAPEVLDYEPLSTACDIWSVGVLAYVMLTGCSPFAGDTNQETFLNISQVNLDFPQDLFTSVSSTAIDFMQQLLIRQPRKRPTATQCLDHSWLHSDQSTHSQRDVEAGTSLDPPLEDDLQAGDGLNKKQEKPQFPGQHEIECERGGCSPDVKQEQNFESDVEKVKGPGSEAQQVEDHDSKVIGLKDNEPDVKEVNDLDPKVSQLKGNEPKVKQVNDLDSKVSLVSEPIVFKVNDFGLEVKLVDDLDSKIKLVNDLQEDVPKSIERLPGFGCVNVSELEFPPQQDFESQVQKVEEQHEEVQQAKDHQRNLQGQDLQWIGLPTNSQVVDDSVRIDPGGDLNSGIQVQSCPRSSPYSVSAVHAITSFCVNSSTAAIDTAIVKGLAECIGDQSSTESIDDNTQPVLPRKLVSKSPVPSNCHHLLNNDAANYDNKKTGRDGSNFEYLNSDNVEAKSASKNLKDFNGDNKKTVHRMNDDNVKVNSAWRNLVDLSDKESEKSESNNAKTFHKFWDSSNVNTFHDNCENGNNSSRVTKQQTTNKPSNDSSIAEVKRMSLTVSPAFPTSAKNKSNCSEEIKNVTQISNRMKSLRGGEDCMKDFGAREMSGIRLMSDKYVVNSGTRKNPIIAPRQTIGASKADTFISGFSSSKTLPAVTANVNENKPVSRRDEPSRCGLVDRSDLLSSNKPVAEVSKENGKIPERKSYTVKKAEGIPHRLRTNRKRSDGMIGRLDPARMSSPGRLDPALSSYVSPYNPQSASYSDTVVGHLGRGNTPNFRNINSTSEIPRYDRDRLRYRTEFYSSVDNLSFTPTSSRNSQNVRKYVGIKKDSAVPMLSGSERSIPGQENCLTSKSNESSVTLYLRKSSPTLVRYGSSLSISQACAPAEPPSSSTYSSVRDCDKFDTLVGSTLVGNSVDDNVLGNAIGKTGFAVTFQLPENGMCNGTPKTSSCTSDSSSVRVVNTSNPRAAYSSNYLPPSGPLHSAHSSNDHLSNAYSPADHSSADHSSADHSSALYSSSDHFATPFCSSSPSSTLSSPALPSPALSSALSPTALTSNNTLSASSESDVFLSNGKTNGLQNFKPSSSNRMTIIQPRYSSTNNQQSSPLSQTSTDAKFPNLKIRFLRDFESATDSEGYSSGSQLDETGCVSQLEGTSSSGKLDKASFVVKLDLKSSSRPNETGFRNWSDRESSSYKLDKVGQEETGSSYKLGNCDFASELDKTGQSAYKLDETSFSQSNVDAVVVSRCNVSMDAVSESSRIMV